ncbi:hypothetical protein IV494_12675 [Kaistella sp. G5-32]|uniref:Uncharacterized protein n=1 Tax=Kaistella gelatinilytica TaxID=2787636 RepID=A0ABS0FEG0_9FLAO|nr:hypothetical protein [Kaistella gelatinilytica]MBF8458033.1 hypothetical protein [Kaistella gelatinilytica]
MNEHPQIEKIKISDDLWLTFRGNKLVFGSSKNKAFHHTISFGNRSGYFDLHVTDQITNKHISIIRWEHQNAITILPDLFRKVLTSIFKLEDFDLKKYEENYALVNSENYDIYTDFKPLIKKNKITLNQEDENFRQVIQKLCQDSNFSKIKVRELNNETEFISLVETENEYFFIIKNSYLDKIYKIVSVDLDFTKIMKGIFGNEVYDEILNRIEKGVKS